ncbi:MAG: retropepsin-like domain-containing protein [Alphaproteobacteria bacterium]|nr:retropepsin-like domain-containing protein [Alphaproteobacteria bacterium]
MVTLLLLGACARLGPFPVPPVEYGEAVELPLVHVPDDTRRLYVLVDTGAMGEQLWFFDTGYSHTTCDAAMIAAQELRARPTLARTRGELGSVGLRRATLPDFDLGGHEVSRLRCAVRDLPATSSIPQGEGYAVAGVLGSNLLRRFVVEVDPAAGVLRLHAPGAVTLTPDFTARRELGVGLRLRVPVTLDGETIWPVLDYGATGTYLDAEALGLPLYQEREGTWQGTGRSNAQTRTLRYHRAAEVALGSVPGPPIFVVQRDGAPWNPGLVGMNVLGHYHLLLDYRSGDAEVEAVEPAPLPVVGD